MKTLNIGMVGGGFMAKAHAMAYSAMPMFFWPAPAIPVRKALAEASRELAADAATRLGFEQSYGDWRVLVDNPNIDIVDIVTPNHLHADIAIAALEAGKHVLCEKPLARSLYEAKAMKDAALKTNLVTMVAYNYRRTPAVVLAKRLIDEGKIGQILNFRGTYLQDWSADPKSPLSWRFQKSLAGSGALGDIASHVIDLAHYLVGDIDRVRSIMKTWIGERPVQEGSKDALGTVKSSVATRRERVDVDDEVLVQISFKNGALGSIEATRNAYGRHNFLTFEVHGELGSLLFNYERRDELKVYLQTNSDVEGFRTIYTGPQHPYGKALWPIPALGIGYGETKIIECYEFVKAVADKSASSPDFVEAYEIERVLEAVIRSSESEGWFSVDSIQE